MTEATMIEAIDLLTRIKQWEDEEISGIVSSRQGLPINWGEIAKYGLLKRAASENRRAIPLVNARFSADPTKVSPDLDLDFIGSPIEGDDIEVSGHISRSTLWLVDGDFRQLQTMQRLLVNTQDGRRRLVDVYSDPVSGMCEEGYPNVAATEPSRAQQVLNLAGEGFDIRGWVEIPEIDTGVLPQY